MKFTGLYIYIDGSDLDDIANSMASDLNDWVSQVNTSAIVVNDKYEKTPDIEAKDYPDWNMGLNIDNGKKLSNELELAVPFLSSLGVKYKRDFIIGYYDRETGISEDIIFFGYENGERSTLLEVKKFLGI